MSEAVTLPAEEAVSGGVATPSLASIAMRICDYILDLTEALVTELRERDPCIRALIRRPLERLNEVLVANPALVEQFIQDAGSVVKFTVADHKEGVINRFGEELLETLTVSFGHEPFAVEFYRAHPAQRLLHSIIVTTSSIPYESEGRALELLKEIATEDQYATYRMTGSLFHRSLHNPYSYVIRRGFPTLVFERTDDGRPESSKFKLGLCAHVDGYFPGYFSGLLCPTDDVIAHLLNLRGDEDGFWKKCNIHLPTSGMLGL